MWYETSQLLLRQAREQNKKAEQREKNLKNLLQDSRQMHLNHVKQPAVRKS